MRERRVNTRGKHRVQKTKRVPPRRSVGMQATVGAVGAAGVALAGAAVIGVAPTMSTSPQLLAALHYLRGTNIGNEPTDQQYEDFIGVVLDGTDTAEPDEPYEKVPYNAGFWPFSHGGFGDLTYNKSVQQGVNLLAAQNPGAGDVIFGFSQGAVSASKYKGTHTGNTYVLVENPSRPNGGIMQRFKGWTIPFVDVTFSGATPDNGDYTVDVARQYDGWADFPKYLWNPLAVANALAGIIFVHGNTQTQLTAADLEAAKASGDSDYYQFDEDSNTEYYLIKTEVLPLLMPLGWFLPDPIIAALDAPLRWFIELAYDRTDYSKPTTAKLFGLGDPDTADVQAASFAAQDETVEDEVVESEPVDTDPAPQQRGAARHVMVDTTGADEQPAGDELSDEQESGDDSVSGDGLDEDLDEDESNSPAQQEVDTDKDGDEANEDDDPSNQKPADDQDGDNDEGDNDADADAGDKDGDADDKGADAA